MLIELLVALVVAVAHGPIVGVDVPQGGPWWPGGVGSVLIEPLAAVALGVMQGPPVGVGVAGSGPAIASTCMMMGLAPRARVRTSICAPINLGSVNMRVVAEPSAAGHTVSLVIPTATKRTQLRVSNVSGLGGLGSDCRFSYIPSHLYDQ